MKARNENLVLMHQTEEKSKKFRVSYPVSEELRGQMVNEVFLDFMTYAKDLYYDEGNLDVLYEFVEDCDPEEEKRQCLLDNLFWFKIFYKPQSYRNGSCIEDYLSDHFMSYRKRPFMTSWLRECDKAVSKFYYIAYIYNDRYYIAIDILTHKTVEVFVSDPKAIPPKLGEIVAGTLLPLGDGLFFPIVDFYHFDYSAREAMGSCFHHHYNSHLENSTMQEAFLHVFAIMLQIEKIVSSEKMK